MMRYLTIEKIVTYIGFKVNILFDMIFIIFDTKIREHTTVYSHKLFINFAVLRYRYLEK